MEETVYQNANVKMEPNATKLTVAVHVNQALLENFVKMNAMMVFGVKIALTK